MMRIEAPRTGKVSMLVQNWCWKIRNTISLHDYRHYINCFFNIIRNSWRKNKSVRPIVTFHLHSDYKSSPHRIQVKLLVLPHPFAQRILSVYFFLSIPDIFFLFFFMGERVRVGGRVLLVMKKTYPEYHIKGHSIGHEHCMPARAKTFWFTFLRGEYINQVSCWLVRWSHSFHPFMHIISKQLPQLLEHTYLYNLECIKELLIADMMPNIETIIIKKIHEISVWRCNLKIVIR